MERLDTLSNLDSAISLPEWLPSEVAELTKTRVWSGYSKELQVTPRMIQTHAVNTGDFQDIHLDSLRATHADFPAPIAHGFLVLGLLPQLLATYAALINADLHVVPTDISSIRILNPVLHNGIVRASMRIVDMQELKTTRRGCIFNVGFRTQTQDPNTERWKYALDGSLSVWVYP